MENNETNQQGGDEMKSTFIVRIWRFLEDHIAVILLSFIPVCLGIVFALGGILCLLPSGIAARLSPSSMEMMLTALGALVVCAIIAILRMIRDITAGKPWRLRRPAIIRTLARFILYLLLLAMDSYFVWRTVLPLGELEMNYRDASIRGIYYIPKSKTNCEV